MKRLYICRGGRRRERKGKRQGKGRRRKGRRRKGFAGPMSNCFLHTWVGKMDPSYFDRMCHIYYWICGLKQQKGGVGSSSRECVYGSLRRKRHVRSLDAWSQIR